MKLYSFYSQSHSDLMENWFNPAEESDLEIEICKFPQIGDTTESDYGTSEFNRTMQLKVDLILSAIKANWGEPFLFCDIDVQFFQPLVHICRRLIANQDILFQRDSPCGQACAGVFLCNSNSSTQRFWTDVREFTERFPEQDDQDGVNFLLFKDPERNLLQKSLQRFSRISQSSVQHLLPKAYRPNGLRWGYLPTSFFSGGTFSGAEWAPGKKLIIPSNAVLHHANWTKGITNKIKQLELVRESVNAKGQGRISLISRET